MKTNYYKCVFAFSTHLIFFLFLTNLNLSAKSPLPAVDCGCTLTLKTAADGGIYSDGSNVKPGGKVCIAAGTYKYINLFNYHGTAQAPIKFINCGGQVFVTGLSYGFSFSNCSYFSFTGTGAPGITYGFKSTGGSTYSASGMGISGSTDFTVDHIDISKSTVGVICKKNPTCDPSTWEAAFTMRNIVFHDLYVHDITGEGFYVGHTSSVVTLTCNGTTINAVPQKIRGLKIYNCRVDSTGWDGIQIASTPEDAQIYNNTVNNFGTKNQSSQQAGILFGGISTGSVYNNYVSNGTGNGIQVLGVGYIQINNNVVVNVGGNNVVSNSKDGIFIDDRPVAGYPAPYYTVCNNTVVSPKRSGVRLENTNKTVTTLCQFHNNLVVASGEPDPNFTTVVIRNNAPNSSTGNFYVSTISGAKFVSSNDYHLSSSSPAINVGVAVNSFGILTDKDGLNRSVGGKPDAGAYEYSATSGTTNIVPVAVPGADEILTLPANSVTLSGSGTDEDGTIAKYLWTEVAGPSQVVIANSATTNPQISNLAEGTYTIRLSVTDNQNATGYNDMQIVVNPALVQPPPPGTQPIPGKIEAESYTDMFGIKTEPTKDIGGGTNISWVHNNDWMDYNVNVVASGTYTFYLRIAAKVNSGQLQLKKGSTVLATVNVPNTGGYQTWTTISTSVSLQQGVQTLRIFSSSTNAWFLNWFEFTDASAQLANKPLASGSISGESLSVTSGAKIISSSSKKPFIKVFPDPVTTKFTVEVNNNLIGLMKIQVIDFLGRIKKEYLFDKNQEFTHIDLSASELHSGAYFTRVSIGAWHVSKMFIKL